MTKSERRGVPRVISQLPLILEHKAEEIQTETSNISASGAYCTLKQFLPPMTKLQVRLYIPNKPNPRSILCQGVVVRVEPCDFSQLRASYNVAILFTDLTDQDRLAITSYVQQRLLLPSSSA